MEQVKTLNQPETNPMKWTKPELVVIEVAKDTLGNVAVDADGAGSS